MRLSTSVEKVHEEMYKDKVFDNLKRVGFDCIDYNMPFYDGDNPNLDIYKTDIKEFENIFKT